MKNITLIWHCLNHFIPSVGFQTIKTTQGKDQFWNALLRKLIIPAVLLSITILFLASCSNRENPLLPPGLDPETYQTGSSIEIYADYLIQSTNDDSYLLIKKESIGDLGLIYQDEIRFQRSTSVMNMDSLRFADGTNEYTGTYTFSVIRSGLEIELYGLDAEVYTNCPSDPAGDLYLITNQYYLEAEKIIPSIYSESRCFFPLTSTGLFSVLHFSGEQEISILSNPDANKTLKTLLMANDRKLQVNFPAGYLSSAGAITLRLESQFSQSDLTRLTNTFPGFALESDIFSLSTSNEPGTLAYVQIQKTNIRKSRIALSRQWVQLSANSLYSWQAQESPNGTEIINWIETETSFHTFARGSGTYFALSPIPSQDLITIPLDGALNLVFIQEIWLDLRSLNIPDTELRLKLNPNIAQTRVDYFSANPFSLQGDVTAYELNFYQQGIQVDTLPDSAWIEFGFACPNDLPDAKNLFRLHRTSTEDILSYKTRDSSYGESSFTAIEGYVYSGISGSGIYLYAQTTENVNTVTIPYYKPKQSIQTTRAIVSWNETRKPVIPVKTGIQSPVIPVKTGIHKRNFTHLELDYSNSFQNSSHPWVNGYPFTLGSFRRVISARFYTSGRAIDSVPDEFFLSLKDQPSASALYVLNSDPIFPKLKKYIPSSSYEAGTFVFNNGAYELYPYFGGEIFTAELNTSVQQVLPVQLFSKMHFDLSDIRIYLEAEAAMPANTVMTVTRRNQMPDRLGILSTQYDLTQLSPDYSFHLPDPGFYNSFQPLIYVSAFNQKRQLYRPDSYLFTIYDDGTSYRIYPFPFSNALDGYHYSISDGFYSYYVEYNGDYCVVQDNSPHTSTSAFVQSAGVQKIVSLYQSQFVLPAEFAGTLLPLQSQIQLSKVDAVPGVTSALFPHRLMLLNQQQQILNPNFFGQTAAVLMPHIYLPFDPDNPDQAFRVWYRNVAGLVRELFPVQEFTDNFANEYVRIGNSALCPVNNPGWFYFTIN